MQLPFSWFCLYIVFPTQNTTIHGPRRNAHKTRTCFCFVLPLGYWKIFCMFQISIFMMLPIVDRIKMERVCRRWRHIAKNYAWSKTTNFSYSSLIGDKVCALPCLIERPVVGNKEVCWLIPAIKKFAQIWLPENLNSLSLVVLRVMILCGK